MQPRFVGTAKIQINGACPHSEAGLNQLHIITSRLTLYLDSASMDAVLEEILDRAARAAGGCACARARAAGSACTAGGAGRRA